MFDWYACKKTPLSSPPCRSSPTSRAHFRFLMQGPRFGRTFHFRSFFLTFSAPFQIAWAEKRPVIIFVQLNVRNFRQKHMISCGHFTILRVSTNDHLMLTRFQKLLTTPSPKKTSGGARNTIETKLSHPQLHLENTRSRREASSYMTTRIFSAQKCVISSSTQEPVSVATYRLMSYFYSAPYFDLEIHNDVFEKQLQVFGKRLISPRYL